DRPDRVGAIVIIGDGGPADDAVRAAAGRLRGGGAGLRQEAVAELARLGDEHPDLRQDVAEAFCAFVREHPARDEHPSGVDSDPAGPEVRRAALAVLADRLRPVPDAAGQDTARWDGIAVDLTGAVVDGVDFTDCRFDRATFADCLFRGTTTFEGARWAGDAVFPRAVFSCDARFTGARFGGEAVFGRARFHGPARFDDARFDGLAWFGFGEEGIWEDEDREDPDDDASAEALGPTTVIPWNEPNEADPHWPDAYLMGEYQSWEEGGDGALFRGAASFRGASFRNAAWFWKVRFGAAAVFRGARFESQVYLDQPAADLTDARASATDLEQRWPFGWTTVPADDGPARLTTDTAVAPYAHQLAAAEASVRLAGLRILDALGDARPGLRAGIVTAVCAYLRTPLPFPVGAESLDDAQRAELAVRRAAQDLLAARLRPADADRFWPDAKLPLSGATLVDLDLSDRRLAYADFTGAQFHGTTRFDGVLFTHGALFRLPGGSGSATFHGPVRHDGADLGEEHFTSSRAPRRHTALATLESLLAARPAP
ncbi:pentapeptide repeat-containing protein, partial [Streptomyces sp. NPDC059605]|uniref:pentapeptide repeat-containing protein n=1 Tax=Streptomyces sp. NPDC059605 TaxID=3346882 RepID=UPI00369E9F80